jgi:hypothetical protein
MGRFTGTLVDPGDVGAATPGPRFGGTLVDPSTGLASAADKPDIARPRNKVDFDALAPGTPYVSPGGVVRMKMLDGSSVQGDMIATPPQAPGHPFGPDKSTGDVLGDLAASAGSGVARGAAELAMSPVTLKQGLEDTVDWGLRRAMQGVQEWRGVPATSDEEFAKRRADVNPIVTATNPDTYTRPLVQDARDAMDATLYKPRSVGGQMIERVGEFVPGALAGGVRTVPDLIRYAAVPALASKGARGSAEALGLSPAAQNVAEILAGGASGGLASLARTPASAAESLVGRAAQGVSAAHWQAAADLMMQAERQGIPLTTAEAVQAVTNGATNLGALQRFAEQSPQSAEQMAQFMAPRSGQVDAAGRRFFDTLAPATDTPSVLGFNGQRAAEGALAEVQGQRSAATAPYYRAANPQAVPQADVEAILADIRAHAAGDQTGLLQGPLAELEDSLIARRGQPGTPARRTPVLGPNGQVVRYQTTPATPPTPDVPITNIENLDRARKYWRERIDAPQLNGTPLDREQGAAIGGYLQRLNQLLEQNPNFLEGKLVHGQMSRDVVDPAMAGPLGQIAGAKTPNVLQQAEALMPSTPLVGSAAEARDAAERMMLQDPEATRGIVRQGLETDFNQATGPKGATQDDQYGGARFASQINGNPERRSSIQNVVEAIAGQRAAQELDELTRVMGATGWRQRPNSATAFNAQIGDQLQGGGIAAVVKALGNAPRAVADWADKAQLGSKVRQIADLLIEREALARAQEMSRRFVPNRGRDAALRAIVQTGDLVAAGQ